MSVLSFIFEKYQVSLVFVILEKSLKVSHFEGLETKNQIKRAALFLFLINIGFLNIWC